MYRVEILKWRRRLQGALAQFLGISEAQAEASVPNITLEVVDISFSQVENAEERSFIMILPTSFVLPARGDRQVA